MLQITITVGNLSSMMDLLYMKSDPELKNAEHVQIDIDKGSKKAWKAQNADRTRR